MTITHRQTPLHEEQESSALAEAIRHLEGALDAPRPETQQEWAARITREVRESLTALRTHQQTVEAPDGLYEELEGITPGGAPKLQRLREAGRCTAEHASRLLQEAEQVSRGRARDVDTVRRHTAELTQELWQLQCSEVGLLFDAYEWDMGGWD